jgi:hypothetical protein
MCAHYRWLSDSEDTKCRSDSPCYLTHPIQGGGIGVPSHQRGECDHITSFSTAWALASHFGEWNPDHFKVLDSLTEFAFGIIYQYFLKW